MDYLNWNVRLSYNTCIVINQLIFTTIGIRLPPSGRNTGKKAFTAFKRKVVVRNLIYPKGRGVSEDDSMAMGDEWGTERDPGFEDGQEETLFSNKKKKKDRKQGDF